MPITEPVAVHEDATSVGFSEPHLTDTPGTYRLTSSGF